MPYTVYRVVLTITTPTGEHVAIERKQRAHSETSAKWSTLRAWAGKPASQAINIQRIELEVAPVSV